jgi:TolA-binding protein
MRARVILSAACALALAGCATKRDIRDLRTDMMAMRSAQEASLQAIQRQNQLLLDSLSSASLRTRGDIANQLVAMERQLVQIQQLTGQGQQRLAELREQINARAEAIATQPAQPSQARETPPPAAQELFDASLASLRRGSFSTARVGFEEFLRLYPQHALAPDAHFHIGEAYAGSKDVPRAVEAYGRVIDQYPNHPRAAAARTARDRLSRTGRS